ncbi:MAG: citrate/2-methylcitrate synthase [Bacteroidales bacterium]|jgi:citrate synthase|nr:citrate/2-methylcitrate synthase [Bacteroidales bacterium]MBR4228767.1 citrate/2-methylcitrate synthase [Bacteroidales bacterium]
MTRKNLNEYLIYKLSDEMKGCTRMDAELFKKLDVKRGLRNEDGTGVLVGLTNIGNVVGYQREDDGSITPVEGRLYFRGYEVKDLVHAIMKEKRFGYEEICFLLLSGRLPDAEELQAFKDLIFDNMPLEQKTILHIIELEGDDIMNILARSVMEFYTFDENPDDVSRDNLMRQSIELISKFPATIAYAYNMYRHHHHGRSLHIRDAQPGLSLAENFLYMLKGSGYTELDARTLDLLLILHSEHGGGNNSTFTVRVTSSTGTDTFSSIAAGIGSLKGPKHGGANLKVCDMIEFMKKEISDWTDEEEIAACVRRLLAGDAFDGSGLVYGIGHAVYTKSDPRAVLLKEMARELAIEKDRLDELEFMERIEKVAIRTIYEVKGEGKCLCANVDFYSGFVYDCIGIPREIYTPLFAMSRIVGWCAHRNEELNFEGRRIIRPAYKCITSEETYVPLKKR